MLYKNFVQKIEISLKNCCGSFSANLKYFIPLDLKNDEHKLICTKGGNSSKYKKRKVSTKKCVVDAVLKYGGDILSCLFLPAHR